MRTLHKTLHLQQHRHTGRLLHHKHTSYRGLALVFVFAGIAMIGVTIAGRVAADSLYVYARIAAPIPTEAPVITSPTDGTKTDKADIMVMGTCPVITPRVIIVLLDNGNEMGSIPCDTNNTFEIPLTLQPGSNILAARPYTITGDAGPDSKTVTVLYTPTLAPSPIVSNTTTSTSKTENSSPPLVLTTDTPFITFGPEKDAVWLGSVSGGTAPYTLMINWGDTATETYQLTHSGQQSYRHHYRIMQPYDITVQVRDTSGQVVTRHYAAVTPFLPPAGNVFTTPPNPPIWSSPRIIGIYGIYLVLLAGFGWLWLHAGTPVYVHVHAQRRATHPKRKH